MRFAFTLSADIVSRFGSHPTGTLEQPDERSAARSLARSVTQREDATATVLPLPGSHYSVSLAGLPVGSLSLLPCPPESEPADRGPVGWNEV